MRNPNRRRKMRGWHSTRALLASTIDQAEAVVASRDDAAALLALHVRDAVEVRAVDAAVAGATTTRLGIVVDINALVGTRVTAAATLADEPVETTDGFTGKAARDVAASNAGGGAGLEPGVHADTVAPGVWRIAEDTLVDGNLALQVHVV